MVDSKRSKKPAPSSFRQRLKSELPRLLREDATLRQQLQQALEGLFPTRVEVSELRALREDFNRFAVEALRRFETMDQRFLDLRQEMDQRFLQSRQEMNQRFESVLKELRTQRLHLSRLSGRLDYGLEYLVREVVEAFAGKSLTRSERLVLKDREGEVFGVPAEIEFDLFASDGEAYLCEVKSHIEADDVLTFNRKTAFAAKHINQPFIRLMIATSMEKRAERLMKSLGIQCIVRAVIEPEPPESLSV